MTYALSFNPEFLRDETDNGVARTPKKQPTSVAQALANLSGKTWSRLAREVFRCEPNFLDIEAVLRKVEETNTCLNLDSPVEVAIDRDGEFTATVRIAWNPAPSNVAPHHWPCSPNSAPPRASDSSLARKRNRSTPRNPTSNH